MRWNSVSDRDECSVTWFHKVLRLHFTIKANDPFSSSAYLQYLLYNIQLGRVKLLFPLPVKSNHKMPSSLRSPASVRLPARPLLPLAAFAGLHLNQGLPAGGPSASWPRGTRLMSLSRHTDLCCNTHGRHHKLSHQFGPIGCGMSWLTRFVEKCTCLCLPSL